jgi:hypothetical protein
MSGELKKEKNFVPGELSTIVWYGRYGYPKF